MLHQEVEDGHRTDLGLLAEIFEDDGVGARLLGHVHVFLPSADCGEGAEPEAPDLPVLLHPQCVSLYRPIGSLYIRLLYAYG